jgi:hypothetical protein
MAKRQIDFTGPSIQDLGIEVKHNGNTQKSTTDNGIAEIEKCKSTISDNRTIVENSEIKHGITNNSNATIGNTINSPNKRIYNTVQFKMIRDYLYAALGNSDRAEIKLSVMTQELGINSKTLYKHLKNLRETEFVVTKLQYSTEIRRR